MPRPTTTFLMPLLGALLFGLATAGLASAQAPVKGEVLVVLAKEAPGPVDARLKKLKALQKPPFSSFKSMKVLSQNGVVLTDDNAPTVDLPNGRTLKLRLVERMPDGRHKIEVAINKKNKKDYLPLLTVIASGEPFFVAGQKHHGGTLVIGVRIGTKSRAKK